MSKQTAVIWFNQQLVERQNGNGDRRSWDEILREALLMEREQIISNYCRGFESSAERNISEEINSEKYYNETYGGQDEK
jgi:molybdate-binding protein